MSAPVRELFIHDDPAAVGEWCRERSPADGLFVAPSASARRLALRRVVEERGVSLGLTVTSRGRLLSWLESRAGLAAPAMIPPTLERLLIAESAVAARVPLFDDDEYDAPAGAVRAVAGLVRALRLNGITPAQYADAGGDPRAADAYRRFETRRGALMLEDEAGRIARLIVAGTPSIPLVLEDPAFPHRAAYQLLTAAIDASPSCRIGLSELGADDASSSVLARLEAQGFAVTRARSAAPAPAMRAVGGVGMQDEVELVARHMLRLLRSGAMVADASAAGGQRIIRPSDILGVAPTSNYLARLAQACVRIGVPVASPRRIAALEVPLVRALLDAARLLADPDEDTSDRGLALLATPYVGLSLARHDQLARTLIHHGLGALRDWRRFAADVRRPRFSALAEAVASLASAFDAARAPEQLAVLLASLALDHGFLSSGRRAHLAAGRDDAVRVDLQGWKALTTAIDELNESYHHLGVARIAPLAWLTELTAALAESSVRVDARAIDGVHLAVAGAGLPTAAHVFAVGWREGLVPRRVRDDPLLSDRVKRSLNEMGAMFPLASDRAAREDERRERIRRAARDSLTISWPATGDDGDQLLPSFYLDDLGVTDRTVRGVGDTTWPVSLAATRGERLARAIFLARHRPAASLGAELDAVGDTLGTLTAAERRAYDGSLHAARTIQLPPEILDEAAALAATMSASQAHAVAHCLYEHFGTRRLGLEALVAPSVDRRTLGTIAHAVLNEVGRAGFDLDLLDDAIERWWNRTIPGELRDDAEIDFEREMLEARLRDLVEAERASLDAVLARATYFELAFGEMDGEGRDAASRAEGLAIALPSDAPRAGSTLRGSIDRVDIVERDGRRYGVAIDYKLGRGKSNFDEMNELADFQLPIYCEVLRLFDIEPVGALYLGIGSGERYGIIRDDFASAFIPDDAKFAKNVKKLGADAFTAFMRERGDALGAQIARVARGELQIEPRKDDCKYCDLRPVCRIGTFGVGGRHDDE